MGVHDATNESKMSGVEFCVYLKVRLILYVC